ncbi:MAG: hypothetical protein PVH88_12125 [Ignavibacteria bacterium]|jgi:hypothetical protein
MGQQQLLLIVLGVIIVGIAVVVGINVFTASSVQANRDGLISDLTNLASMAQQFYRKPTALGGGGNTFTGWSVPTNLASTGNGSYAETVTAQAVTIVATGNETGNDGSAAVQITMIVDPDSIRSTVIDN